MTGLSERIDVFNTLICTLIHDPTSKTPFEAVAKGIVEELEALAEDKISLHYEALLKMQILLQELEQRSGQEMLRVYKQPESINHQRTGVNAYERTLRLREA